MRVANLDDSKEIAQVLNSHLGRPVCHPAEIEQLIEAEDWVIYVIDNDENHVVGVASGHMIAEPSGLSTHLLEHWDTVASQTSVDGPVLLVKSVAVDDAYRGCGIASDLVRHVIQWGRHQGCTAVFSIGWTDAEGCHIEPVFVKLGIDVLMDVENFWTNGSIEKVTRVLPAGTRVAAQRDYS